MSFRRLALSAACPRGSVSELTDPGSIFIDAARGITITGELKNALQARAFTLATNRDDAEILLRVTSEAEDQRIVSVQSTGRVSEFELKHSVAMLIAQAIDGNPPVYAEGTEAGRVEVIREYTYDERSVLGKENEARTLRQEMREELVRQIVLRTIAGLAPNQTTVQ